MSFNTSLHSNHPGRRTTMTTAPVFSHRVFALCRSWTERQCYESERSLTLPPETIHIVQVSCLKWPKVFAVHKCSVQITIPVVCNSLPPVVFSSVFSRTSRLAHAGLVWNQSVKELMSSATKRLTTFRTAVTVTMSVHFQHRPPAGKHIQGYIWVFLK